MGDKARSNAGEVGPKVLEVNPGRLYVPPRRSMSKVDPDLPTLSETCHPAWAAFMEMVAKGERPKVGKSPPVVREDLLECGRAYWGFVWDVFRGGWEAGRSG